MEGIVTLINNIGFPCACCVGLAIYCKMLFQKNNEIYNRLFDMYEKANSENRTAIENCTKAIDNLCDRLENMK